MSKRSADIQITQDNQFDFDKDNADENDSSKSFKIADESVLKNRAIKVPKSRFKLENKTLLSNASSSISKNIEDNNLTNKGSVFKNFSFGANNTSNPPAFGSNNSTQFSQEKPNLFSNNSSSFSSTQTESSETKNAPNLSFNTGSNSTSLFNSTSQSAAKPINGFKSNQATEKKEGFTFDFAKNTDQTTTSVADPPKSNLFGSAFNNNTSTDSSKSFGAGLPVMPSYSFGAFNSNNSSQTQDDSSTSSITQSSTTSSGFSFGSLTKNDSSAPAPKENKSLFNFGPKSSENDASESNSSLSAKPVIEISNSKLTNSTTSIFSSAATNSTSLFGSSSSKPNSHNIPSSTSSLENAKSTISANSDRIKDYLKSIRGLNSSFVKIINSCYESDPFEDFSSLFSQYSKFLTTINSNYEDVTSQNKSQSNSLSNDNTQASTSSLFTNNNLPSKSSASNNNTNLNSQPISKSVLGGKSINFGVSKSDKTEGDKPKSLFAPKNHVTASVSLFDKDNKDSSKSLNLENKNSNAPSLFGSNNANVLSTADNSKPTGLFSSNNSSLSISSSIFKTPLNDAQTPSSQLSTSNTSDNVDSDKPKLATFVVGGKVSTSAIMSPKTVSDKSSDISKSFSFGSTQTAPTSIFGNNIGSSLFGSSFKAATPTAQTSLFGNTNVSSEVKTTALSTTNDQDENEPIPASPSKLASSASTKGAGEEEETTIYDVRAKIFKYDANYEGGAKYVDLGVGFLRINTREVNGKKLARVLCRQDGTSLVTLNSAINKQTPLHHKEGSKDVLLVSFESSDSSTKFLIRVKTPAMSNDLFEKIKSTINSL
ncbi:Nucleoporin nup61 [Smittium culicis]|uniref:Nucleoporin nup61 n=1 Tax=Smittium culicis TaxID=133412 RepID=A0A1R1XGK7_9FUNG|nr:Nucleoporin nup61 [Smittium culicis]